MLVRDFGTIESLTVILHINTVVKHIHNIHIMFPWFLPECSWHLVPEDSAMSHRRRRKTLAPSQTLVAHGCSGSRGLGLEAWIWDTHSVHQFLRKYQGGDGERGFLVLTENRSCKLAEGCVQMPCSSSCLSLKNALLSELPDIQICHLLLRHKNNVCRRLTFDS